MRRRDQNGNLVPARIACKPRADVDDQVGDDQRVDTPRIFVDVTSAGGAVVVTFTDRVTSFREICSRRPAPRAGLRSHIAHARQKFTAPAPTDRLSSRRPTVLCSPACRPGMDAAVTDAKPGEWFDPAFHRSARTASERGTVPMGKPSEHRDKTPSFPWREPLLVRVFLGLFVPATRSEGGPAGCQPFWRPDGGTSVLRGRRRPPASPTTLHRIWAW